MKLYGSLNNRLMEGAKSEAPSVGAGATVIAYSDRHPATIAEVVSPSRFFIQRDTVTHDKTKPGGMGHQNWLITPDPKAARELVTLRKDGKFHLGTSMQGSVVLVGVRQAHHDWEF
jgi:hypothetical protein